MTRQLVAYLVVTASNQLAREPKPTGQDAVAGSDPGAELSESRHLVVELSRLAARARAVTQTLTTWKTLLVSLTEGDPDPVRRFRRHADAGQFAAASNALGTVVPDHPDDVERLLNCLAALGELDRYREVLVRHGAGLPVVVVDPADPTALPRRVGPALVTVRTTWANGDRTVVGGFLVSDRVVVTNQRAVVNRTVEGHEAAEPGQLEVLLGVVAADVAAADVAAADVAATDVSGADTVVRSEPGVAVLSVVEVYRPGSPHG
nr:hypothetical protein [Micromonospora sp. DSM 115978]